MHDLQIEATFQRYLRPGERIRWTGRPAKGVQFTPLDVFLIPFSLLWGGFAIFWELTVLGIGLRGPPSMHAVPIFMAVFGGVFVLAGLFMIIGRFWLDAWLRSHTLYALTDRRAMSLRTKPNERLMSTDLKEPNVVRKADDNGTLTFTQRAPGSSLFSAFADPSAGWSIWIPALSRDVQFVGIRNVSKVYQLALAASAPP